MTTSISISLPRVARPLVLLAAACLAALAASLILMLVDTRQLMGASVWLKPAKFAASIGVTAATLALLLRHVRLPAKAGPRVVAVIVATAMLEQAIITLQAARGVASHFNATSTLNIALFTTMGVGIVIFTIAIGVIGWFAFRQRFADRALGWGVRLGFAAMLAGSTIAFVMPRPTPAQIDSLRAGRPTPMLGAHAVGVPDGGPGLPVTRWSTEGGDLRVPHFIGIHALQLLPLVGWRLGRRGRGSTSGAARAVRLTVVVGAGTIGMVAVTLVQALRGVPVLAPDGTTIALALALAAGCAIAAAWPARACVAPLPSAASRSAPKARSATTDRENSRVPALRAGAA
jgi:hypothetical protein